jgi:hypothetical protein
MINDRSGSSDPIINDRSGSSDPIKAKVAVALTRKRPCYPCGAGATRPLFNIDISNRNILQDVWHRVPMRSAPLRDVRWEEGLQPSDTTSQHPRRSTNEEI